MSSWKLLTSSDQRYTMTLMRFVFYMEFLCDILTVVIAAHARTTGEPPWSVTS